MRGWWVPLVALLLLGRRVWLLRWWWVHGLLLLQRVCRRIAAPLCRGWVVVLLLWWGLLSVVPVDVGGWRGAVGTSPICVVVDGTIVLLRLPVHNVMVRRVISIIIRYCPTSIIVGGVGKITTVSCVSHGVVIIDFVLCLLLAELVPTPDEPTNDDYSAPSSDN